MTYVIMTAVLALASVVMVAGNCGSGPIGF